MALNMDTLKTAQPTAGLHPTQPVQMDNNTARAALAHSSHLRMETFKANGQTWATKLGQDLETSQSNREAAYDNSALGLTVNTIKGLPGAAYNMGKDFVKGLYKFGKSAVTAPYTLATGGKTVPGTYESDSAQTAADVFDQKTTPLAGTVNDVAPVVGEGATILGAADLAPGVRSLAGKAVDAASDVADTVGTKLASRAESKATKTALDVVAPKLTKAETEEALAAGRGKGGGLLSKTKITPNQRTLDVADAVKGIVKKGATGAENINNIRTALSDEADNLKSQIASVDKTYNISDLGKKFSDIENPISIRGTAFEKQIDAVKEAAMNIVNKSGNKISNLLDARKEFDSLVNKEYPNLYDKEYAPMKNAITSIRNSMNDFIEENLPENVKFKDSLRKQSLYYDAIDNIAGKSADEVGKTGIQRKVGNFIKKHPVASTAIGGAATGGLYEGTKSAAQKVIGG